MINFSLGDILNSVNSLLILYSPFRMTIISSIVILAIGYYLHQKSSRTGRRLSAIQDETKIVRYLRKCILDTRHNEDSIPKCKYFIQKHPNVINLQRKPQGSTLFQIACNYGIEELVSFMLELGADINILTKKNQNILYLATMGIIKQKSNNFNVLKMLIDVGVPINKLSGDGYTPLMLAAMYGCDDLVKWLLMNGADPMVKRKNCTALNMAQTSGHESTAALLCINTDED